MGTYPQVLLSTCVIVVWAASQVGGAAMGLRFSGDMTSTFCHSMLELGHLDAWLETMSTAALLLGRELPVAHAGAEVVCATSASHGNPWRCSHR